MSNKRDDSGPAFPVAENHQIADELEWTAGMSMRDFFASKVMQGIVSADNKIDLEHRADDIAYLSYVQADAMLKEREK